VETEELNELLAHEALTEDPPPVEGAHEALTANEDVVEYEAVSA
jgi:hypothetical protein